SSGMRRSPNRTTVALLALVLLSAACTATDKRASGDASGPPGTIASLRSGATTLSLLSGNGLDKGDAIQTGRSYYVFDLSTGSSQLITGGSPKLYIAKTLTSKPLGPFTATWSLFTGYQKTGDTSPRSPIPGVYWAEVDIPSPGI